MNYPTKVKVFGSDQKARLWSSDYSRDRQNDGFNVERRLIPDVREGARPGATTWAVYWSAGFLTLG